MSNCVAHYYNVIALTSGTFDIQDCDVHTDNTSILVECTFAINSTAPGIVVIQDEQSQYTTNRTLHRLGGDSKGSVNITDLPAGEYNVSVFDQSEDTKPAYVHHNHLQVKPPAIISFYLTHTPAVSIASESINSVSNGNLDYILIQ